MRHVLLIVILLALTAPAAFAQGNGNGNGNGNGGNNGNGPSENSGNGNGNSGNNENGNGNSGDTGNKGGGNGNGNAGGNGNGNAGGNGNGNSSGPDTGSRPAPVIPRQTGTSTSLGAGSSGEVVQYSEDDARDAASSGRAVSLGSLLPDITARTGGEMIDAQLLRVRGFLVYAVKVLSPAGRVTTEYYYAQSGIFIGSEP